MRTTTVSRSEISTAIRTLNIGRLSFKRIAQNDTDYSETERGNALSMQSVYAEEMRELFALRNSCTDDGTVRVEIVTDDNSASDENAPPEHASEEAINAAIDAGEKASQEFDAEAIAETLTPAVTVVESMPIETVAEKVTTRRNRKANA